MTGRGHRGSDDPYGPAEARRLDPPGRPAGEQPPAGGQHRPGGHDERAGQDRSGSQDELSGRREGHGRTTAGRWRRAGEDGDGALRGLLGAGRSKISSSAALRARDVARPSADDLAEAERVIADRIAADRARAARTAARPPAGGMWKRPPRPTPPMPTGGPGNDARGDRTTRAADQAAWAAGHATRALELTTPASNQTGDQTTGDQTPPSAGPRTRNAE